MSETDTSTPRIPEALPAQARRPLTQHPLFRIAMVLWFATLFALSMLAVSRNLLERAALWLHLDALLPVGGATRLALATVMGSIGGALGLQASTRLTGAKPSEDAGEIVPESVRVRSGAEMLERFRIRPRDAHPDAPARAPFRVSEDFALAGPVSEAPRMTALSAEPVDPAEPAVTPPEAAPFDVSAPVPQAQPQATPVSEPYAPLAAPSAPAPTAADRIAEAPLDMLSSVELIERLAIAMQRRLDRNGGARIEGARNEDTRQSGIAPSPETPPPSDTASLLTGALASLRALG